MIKPSAKFSASDCANFAYMIDVPHARELEYLF